MALVELVYAIGPASDPLNVLGCFLVHPHIMEDSKVDTSVQVALLHSWWFWPGSFGQNCQAKTTKIAARQLEQMGPPGCPPWLLQQHMALETNASKWQCKQLGIPPALATGATPARLLSSVPNNYSKKNGLNHLGYKDLAAGATMAGAAAMPLELLAIMASKYA